MELSTTTVLILVAATILLVALLWVLIRAVPRTRGKLRAETSLLDVPSRRVAATLLGGWGTAAGWAMAAGIAVYLVLRVVTEVWARGVSTAAHASYYEQTDEHFQGFMACQRLPESSPGATEAEVERCYRALGEAPLAPPQANDAWPLLLGLLVPLVAVMVTLGLLALLVARRKYPEAAGATVVSAHVQPRGFLSFGPRWAMAIPAAAALLLCGWLVATGLASSKDAYGRFTRMVVQRNSAADDPEVGYALPLTPGPQSVDIHGWYFGVPVIAAALLLLVIAVLLLRALAQAPRPRDPSLLRVDDLARTLKAKFVAGVAGAGMLAALAPVAVHTGGAMLTVAGDLRVVGENIEFFYHDTMLSGAYSYVAGLLFTALAILMLVLAVGSAVELVAARKLAVALALDEEKQGSGPEFR
jgi:uncharacterized membrane protein